VILDDLAFGQPEQRLDGVAFPSGLNPEIQWHRTRHIATETIYIIFFHPVFHGADHAGTQLRYFIVKVDYIYPSIYLHEVALCVLSIPFRVLNGPLMGIASMVRYPVDDHFHSMLVCRRDEGAKIISGAVKRVNVCIRTGGVITAIGSLSLHFTDRRDGH